MQNIIEICEDKNGFDIELSPFKKIVLKLFYGLELDDINIIEIADEGNGFLLHSTEKEAAKYLQEKGFLSCCESNKEKTRLFLNASRQAGKSFLGAVIVAYELYKVLNISNPCLYYNLPQGSKISFTMIGSSLNQSQHNMANVAKIIRKNKFLQSKIIGYTVDKITFTSDSDITKPTIELICGSINSLRGINSICVYIDEIEFISGDPYSCLAPSTNGFSGDGKVICFSTPGIHSFFSRFEKETDENLLSIKAGLLMMNPPTFKQG